MHHRVLLFVFYALVVSACASTTTTTSTGEDSDVSIDEVFSDEDRTGPSGAATQSNNDISALPGIDEQSFQDFDAFKSWLRARQAGTPESMEFQIWREYLEYLRITNQ